MREITAPERKSIADAVGVDEQYLYQCLTGRKAMNPAESVRIERESNSRIRRWHLRQDDWHRIWPELIGTDGAPAIKAQKAA
jgi:DNA-binding transcriptional regulator YdaS (Cro superfamily)